MKRNAWVWISLLLVAATGALAEETDCATLPRVLGKRGSSGPGPSARPLIPDRFRAGSIMRYWKSARFSPACRELNRCYSRLNAIQSLCDEDFLRGLQKACKDAYNQYGEKPALARCLLAAGRYHKRLMRTDKAGFRDAQYEARWLEDAGKRKIPRTMRKWWTEERPVPGSQLVPLPDPN